MLRRSLRHIRHGLLAATALLGCGAKTGLRIDSSEIKEDGEALCVELPFEEIGTIDVEFEARIVRADVALLVDTTGSMGDEIDKIRATLRDTIIPGLVEAIPEIQMSVAHFGDFPESPYGASDDIVFEQLLQSTSDADAIQDAVDRLPLQDGGDAAEAQVEALYQAATGEGLLDAAGGAWIAPASCAEGYVGYGCFLEQGSPIILLFSDAEFHEGPGGSARYVFPGPHSYEDTVSELRAIGAQVLGFYSGNGGIGAMQLDTIARDTGAVDSRGESIVFDIGTTGENLDEGVISAVSTLVNDVPIDIDLLIEDVETDAVDARLLVRSVTALRAVPSSGATVLDSRFSGVIPGTRVIFRLEVANDLVAPGNEPLRIPLRTVMRGNGISRLSDQIIEFVVPSQAGVGCVEPR